MGIVPLWGFQMLIAIAISIRFRFNKALVLIAANISIPPLIPAILYLSHYTGKIWMGKNAAGLSFSKGLTLETIYNHFSFTNFMQYVSGAITLALVAGLFFGLVTYILLKIPRRKKLV
jgi:uncharacterized protein (DUF2062 family)